MRGSDKVRNMEIPQKQKIKRHIWIESDMFYSAAFKSISRSASAIITLMRCLQKRKWEQTKSHSKKKTIYYTDDGFIFPYAEAALLGIGTTQHWKNMNKLIDVGFLDLVHQGGWYQKHDRDKDYSVYKYSERWRKYGTAEFVPRGKKESLRKSSYIRVHLERQKLKSTSLKRKCQLHSSEGDRPKMANDRFHNSEGDHSEQNPPESLVSSG